MTQKLKGLELAIKKLYKHGITTFQDAMVRKSNLSVWLASYGVVPNKVYNIHCLNNNINNGINNNNNCRTLKRQ